MKLQQILNGIREQQLINDMLDNENDYYAGYICYKAYTLNKRYLENELKNLKAEEATTC